MVSFRMRDSDAGRHPEPAPVLPIDHLLRCSRSWPWQGASAGSAATAERFPARLQGFEGPARRSVGSVAGKKAGARRQPLASSDR